MNSPRRSLPFIAIILLVLVSLACGQSSTPVPTIDPNAIDTAIAGTTSAQPTANEPTNTSQATFTPASTLTTLPTDTLLTIEITAATLLAVASDLVALGASCIPNNPPQTGKVVHVVDGDTVKVLLDQDGQTYTVRYIGMDTPESTTEVEYFGAEASAKNAELVYGKNATLIKDVSETDQYGRLLRYVIVDNLFVNYELVAQGYANTASYPPDIACIPTFQEAEQKARLSNLGLWNAPPTVAALPTRPSTNSGNSGGNAACNCSGPDLNCGDFSTHASAQTCHDYCESQGLGDIFGLDGHDNDGLACESLP